jgi:putative flippase GtrA
MLTIFRYLAVGACNTIFGYGCFALFTLLLTPVLSYGYVAASILANLFSITFAFLGYKWLVFKTKGNYLREWIRCVGIYAGGMILSAAALPLVVGVIRRQPGTTAAPHILPEPSFLCFQSCSASSAIATFPSPTGTRPRKAHLNQLGSRPQIEAFRVTFVIPPSSLACGITELRARISP